MTLSIARSIGSHTSSNPPAPATHSGQFGDPVSGKKRPEIRGFAKATCSRRLKVRDFRPIQRAHRASVSGRDFGISGIWLALSSEFIRDVPAGDYRTPGVR